jgi:tRNA-modifying protein YgfZ
LRSEPRRPSYVATLDFGFDERIKVCMNIPEPMRRDPFGALLVSGPDARNFLQGQLTADVQRLSADNVLLAACNSAQGRVQAVLWLVERGDGIALLMNQALLQQTLTRLRRYVLRAKVTLEAERLQIALTSGAELTATLTEDRTHRQVDERSYVRLPGHSHLLMIAPASESFAADWSASSTWHAEHLRAGLPEIYPQTHEQFVAQMLNLDLLDGIDFEKGCYTGQEIIARTHFRGAIKRRMFRFSARCPAPAPGTRLLTGDQHAGDVVDVIAVDGGCELLAVVSLPQLNEPLELETNRGVVLEKLVLPYDIEVAR